jgi:hypothetical protein
MIKLEKKPQNFLQEMFQSINTKFAFIHKKGNKYKELTVPSKCRDFLGDCIWSKKTKQEVNIYNFTYDYNKTPYNKDCLRLSMTFPNEKTKLTFTNNYPLIYGKEKQANTTFSNFQPTQDPLTIYIEADKAWQSCVWKISLYTFYLKLMCYKTIGDVREPENQYIKLLTPEKENIFLTKIKKGKEYLSTNQNFAHNFSGFYSILTGISTPETIEAILGGPK